MISTPTYGMYKVCAAVNEVAIVDVPLAKDWQMDTEKVFITISRANLDYFNTEIRSNY